MKTNEPRSLLAPVPILREIERPSWPLLRTMEEKRRRELGGRWLKRAAWIVPVAFGLYFMAHLAWMAVRK